MRYALNDDEWRVIQPMLPNKPRGVPRVDDRRVLYGIFWVLPSSAPWRDLPACCGPHTTCHNRFVRWRRAGVWNRVIDALAAAHDGAVQMIASCFKVAIVVGPANRRCPRIFRFAAAPDPFILRLSHPPSPELCR